MVIHCLQKKALPWLLVTVKALHQSSSHDSLCVCVFVCVCVCVRAT